MTQCRPGPKTLANARLILPDETIRGWLVIADGRIVDLGQGRAVPRGAEDCDGDHLCPGLIELHTDNLERHIQPRPGVDWPHDAAILAHDAELAGAGIASVYDALRVGTVDTAAGRERRYARQVADEIFALRAQGLLRISHFLHLRAEICSQTLPEEMAEFGPDDRVGIVSLMDHTPGQRQFRDLSKLATYVKGRHGLDDAGFAAHVAQLQGLRATQGDRHEAVAVAEARRYGAALASHDDATPAQVAASARHGARMAEFPTTLDAAHACRETGLAVIMGAPNVIRGGSHSGNVAAQDLAEAGLLDILSSDYVPSALLLAAMRLGEIWGDLPRGLTLVTAAPARAAGLADRGVLRPGARADILRFAVAGRVPVVRALWSAGRRVA